jgi:hypothetical protein
MATVRQPTGATGPGGWLLRLYPETWRDRYGAEFAELLLARPPSPRDRFDIVRGAVDARLNPQLTEEPVVRVATAADRLLALAGVLAGALFTVWASIIEVATPRWESVAVPDENLMAAAYGAGLLGMILAVCVLTGLAARYVDELGSFGAIAAVVVAAGFFFAVGGATIVAVLVLTGGTLALAPALARVVHPLVASFLALTTVLLALAMFGFAGSGGQDTFWLVFGGGFGPAWMILGISLRRGRRADRIATAGIGRSGASASPAGA